MTSRAQHGSIDVPDVGSLPALVDLDSGHATAVLLVRPLHALDGVVGTHVSIDIATRRGLLHCDARVAAIRDGDVLDLEVDGDREIIQRRSYARVDAVLEVEVAPGVPAAAMNISGSGAVVSQLDGLQAGDPVELSLRLGPHEPPIVIGGRVVRECAENLRAIHFERVALADRERIVHWVFERQRLEIQRVRRAS
jgi:hypothetical protein